MEDIIKKNAAIATEALEKESAAETAENELAREFGVANRPFPNSYPGGITPETLFDMRTERIVRAQADKLITTGLFEKHERDDIENEMRIVLAYEMSMYDPSKNRYTFTATVLAKRGLNAVIKRKNHLRDNPRPVSLNEPVSDMNCATWLDVIAADDEEERRAREVHEAKTERRLHCLVESLDPVDSRICKAVMEGSSIREIARAVGMAVSSVHHRLRVIIAAKARENGLAEGGAI